MKMQMGYNFVPEKMFSGMKSDFFSFALFQGVYYYILTHGESFPSGKEIFVMSYL